MAKSFWDSEETVCDVEKQGTKGTFYRIKKVSKNGREYIDLREHYTKQDGAVQYTTKGTSIPMDNLKELAVVLTALAEEKEEK